MKNLKKLASLALVILMVAALCIPAVFAAEETGKITVTNAETGKVYSAYKVFDATYDAANDAIAYSVKAGTVKTAAEAEDSPFQVSATADVDGNFAVTLKDGKTIADIIAWANANLSSFTAADSKTAASKTVEFDLPYGYYFITSTLGAVVTIDTNTPSVEVVDKNEKPGKDFDKNIVEGDTKTKAKSVNVGDTVDYVVSFKGMNYDGNDYVTNFYVYDKMNEALTFNDDIVVKIGDKTLVNGTDYSIVKDTTIDDVKYNFVLNIFWTNNDGEFLYENDCDTVITYSATVNEKVLTAGAMENAATYNYKSLPSDTPEENRKPDKTTPVPTPVETKSEAKAYSAEIELTKVDSANQILTGAKFSIAGIANKKVVVTKEVFAVAENGEYFKLRDGKYTKDAPVTENYMKEAAAGADKGYVVDNEYTGDDKVVIGDTTYRPLSESDTGVTVYVLVEANGDLYESTTTKYEMKTEKSLETAAESVNITEEVRSDGKLNFIGLGEGTYTITEVEAPAGYNKLEKPITVTLTFDAETEKWTYTKDEGNEAAADGGKVAFDVVNNKGTVLPSTGGAGTALLIFGGAFLFLATAVVLVAKKRLYNEG